MFSGMLKKVYGKKKYCSLRLACNLYKIIDNCRGKMYEVHKIRAANDGRAVVILYTDPGRISLILCREKEEQYEE